MKANVFETEFAMASQELGTPVRAQREGRVATADGMFPEMRKYPGRLQKVALKVWHRQILLS
jgi:hypothetical protein